MMRSVISIIRPYRVKLVIATVLLSCLGAPLLADPVGPSANDRHVTLAVAALLSHEHLTKHPLDDVISRRCIKTYLKNVDPWKLYFYQADVDTFMQQKDNLDDQVKRGDIRFAFQVYTVFLKRVDERLQVIDELLAMKHDFTVDEQMVIDRDKTKYSRDTTGARDRWRKRIKYDLLVLKEDGTEGEKAIEKLTRRYHSFAKRMHQTDDDEVLEMYLTSLTTSYDPHTTYMSPGTQENFEIQMRLGLDGIGASLQPIDGYTVVHKVIPGGAADKDGQLKTKDKIVAVGQGTEGEMVDVVDMKLSDVVKLIRGKRGTVVRMSVIPADGSERKNISITRAKIELKDSEARGTVFNEGKKEDGTPHKIGVIDLPSFYMDMEASRNGDPNFKSTTRDVRKILERFKTENVDIVILDLRRNGGGSLIESINLTGLFIDQGPVVQVKNEDNRGQTYRDLEPGAVWSGPLVVLISKFSASASEILAGAIQDYERGLIVGDHSTHGKGTVQSFSYLGQKLFRFLNAPKMGALKITMQQFYRPNGDSTQNRGVLADIELPSITTHLDIGESDLDYPVAFNRVSPEQFKKLNEVNPAICNRLRQLSVQRVQKSKDFQKVLKSIARYNELKDRTYQTLNEKKFMAERAELNVDKEQKKEIEKIRDADSSVIKRDYYLNEAIAISLDYIKLRASGRSNSPQVSQQGRAVIRQPSWP